MKKKIISYSLIVCGVIMSGGCCDGAKATNEIVTSSGLKYIVTHAVKDAHAPVAKKGMVVQVHYTGWLQGKTANDAFDSSRKRGVPFEFVLGAGQVIKGWDEGVAGMRVGEKRQLIIPAHLGYGAYGAGRLIPGNATLVFDVELVAVK